MKGLSWKAIALGIAVDLGATLAYGVVLFVGTFVAILAFHASPSALRAFATSPLNMGASMVFGLGTTFWGGWITASRAPEAPWRNAGAAGIVTVLLFLPFLFLPNHSPLWYKIASYSATAPAMALGAWPVARKRGRAESSSAAGA